MNWQRGWSLWRLFPVMFVGIQKTYLSIIHSHGLFRNNLCLSLLQLACRDTSIISIKLYRKLYQKRRSRVHEEFPRNCLWKRNQRSRFTWLWIRTIDFPFLDNFGKTLHVSQNFLYQNFAIVASCKIEVFPMGVFIVKFLSSHNISYTNSVFFS